MKSRSQLTAFAETMLAERWPRAACGFAAGSLMRGEGTASSDLDLVVLFDDDGATVYRESFIRNGIPVEAFIHTVAAQDRFMEQDRAAGMPATPSMVAEGVVLGAGRDLAERQKAKAAAIFAAGPPKLAADEIDRRRYFITDLLDDVASPRDAAECQASLTRLHGQLGDFHLRAHGSWSGSGKTLIRELRRNFPGLASDFEQSFAEGFSGDASPVQALADRILKPFGGRLWAGYRAEAPAK